MLGSLATCLAKFMLDVDVRIYKTWLTQPASWPDGLSINPQMFTSTNCYRVPNTVNVERNEATNEPPHEIQTPTTMQLASQLDG